MAWCMVSMSRWSSLPSLTISARTSGPCSSLKGVPASLCSRARTGKGSDSTTALELHREDTCFIPCSAGHYSASS